jgi:Bacteriophage holin of superfamily 6 (Holin_LLH)
VDTFLQDPATQQAIANILLIVVTGVVGALAKAFYTWVKTNTSASQFSLLEQIASSAVDAAEQGAIAGFVKDRKATAIAIVNEGLKNAGVKNLTAEQIDAAIEAAVKANLNDDKQFIGTPLDGAEIEAEPETIDEEVVEPEV